MACLQLRCRCMYRIFKSLTRLKLIVKKHVYGGFIKVIIKEGVRAKEGLVCLSSKFSLLKPNNLVSMTHIHIHLPVVCEACKQSHVYTEHTVLYH